MKSERNYRQKCQCFEHKGITLWAAQLKYPPMTVSPSRSAIWSDGVTSFRCSSVDPWLDDNCSSKFGQLPCRLHSDTRQTSSCHRMLTPNSTVHSCLACSHKGKQAAKLFSNRRCIPLWFDHYRRIVIQLLDRPSQHRSLPEWTFLSCEDYPVSVPLQWSQVLHPSVEWLPCELGWLLLYTLLLRHAQARGKLWAYGLTVKYTSSSCRLPSWFGRRRTRSPQVRQKYELNKKHLYRFSQHSVSLRWPYFGYQHHWNLLIFSKAPVGR